MEPPAPNQKGFLTEGDYREAGGFDDGAVQRNEKLFATMVRHNSGIVPKNLLDVGCGVGGFLECCKSHGVEGAGIEGADFGYNACVGKGLKCHKVNLETEPFPVADKSFDVVFCNQVIEHLTPESGRRLVMEAFRVLNDDGAFLIFTPSYYSPLNRTQPFHIHCYRPNELRAVIKETGFKEITHLPSPIQYHVLRPYREGEAVLERRQCFPMDALFNILFLIYGAEALDGSAHFVCSKTRRHAKDVGDRRQLVEILVKNAMRNG
jgi:SAM-dependent methyltransferase